jgi:proteasome lid subunit RPN8/RPN11
MSEVIKEFLKPKLTRGSVLRFTPYSWAKILYMRDIKNCEMGGYGVCETDDPLLITNFYLVKQEVSGATVELDKEDSSRFMEEMTDKGFSPWQYAGNWIHSHPGNSASPSLVDEENFNKNFSLCDVAIFFIIAKGGDKYCRVRHNTGPGIEVTISTEIDYSCPFPASDKTAWEAEYKDKVTESKSFIMMGDGNSNFDWMKNWKKDPERLYGKSQQTVGEILESIQEKEEMDENLQMWWDQSEDCVWFYNNEEEDYWKYSPGEQAFFDHDDSRISVKNIPKECKIGDIIRFGNESFKQEYGSGVVANNNEEISDSFLSEVEEVEPCPYG